MTFRFVASLKAMKMEYTPERIAITNTVTIGLGGLLLRNPLVIVFALGLGSQLVLLRLAEEPRRRSRRERLALLNLRRSLIRVLAERRARAPLAVLARRLSHALHGVPVLFALRDDADGDYRERANSRAQSEGLVLPQEGLRRWHRQLSDGRWLPRDRAHEVPSLRAQLDAAGIESLLPLAVDRDLLGVIAIGAAQGWRPDSTDIVILEDIGRELGALLKGARLRSMAATDPLTGLPRRHIVEARIAHEIKRSARSGTPFSVVLGDVDHFKRVNDEYGHVSGDAVLQRIARALLRGSRRIDLVGRWGGEEFILVLPDTDVEGAVAAAEKLRQSVEATASQLGERRIRTTISFGVVTCAPAMYQDTVTVVAAADQALYRAKRAGRNRTVLHDASESMQLAHDGRS